MSTVTQHAPGTFCWPELGTSDAKAAKKFYAALFGWTIHENDIGGGETYTMLKHLGQEIGALYQLRADQVSQGVPPHWLSYVAVANADETAQKATRLGGKALMEPFDVMDFGRMAALQDPTGATFAIWQAKKHIGASKINEPGSMCWNELMTYDTNKAGAFYQGIFGWLGDAQQIGPTVYTIFKIDTLPSAGMASIPKERGQVPPHWLAYFAVDDCDQAASQAVKLGGKTLVSPSDIPNVGRFSILQDPQCAVFAVIQLAT